MALGTAVHWTAGLSTAMAGLLAAGYFLKPAPDASRLARGMRVSLCVIAYGGLTSCMFALSAAVGWIGVALAVAGLGLWLITGTEHGEA
ncbi:hypothetical protein [Streptomyces clavifer]|uniref:hypothetical protein n=1 Tax=Streptomyces clavifer TaxID=68188 RepID=UPI0037F29D32